MHRPRWGVALLPLVVIGAAATFASPARAAAADGFASSFETGDPQPTWSDTVDTDAAGHDRSSGVDGNVVVGMPGTLRGHVIAIAVNAQPNANENGNNLNDGDSASKWLVDTPTSWAQYTLSAPATVVRYALTSANDAPERDPSDWTLAGSPDNGATWTTVDTQAGQTFDQRFQTKTYDVAHPGEFTVYRLTVTGHPSGNLTQLADLELADGNVTAPPAGPMQSRIGNGPGSSPTAKAGAGYTGLKAFQISGRHTAAGWGYSYNKVFDVDLACPTTPRPGAARCRPATSPAATTTRRPRCRTASTSGPRRPTPGRPAGSTSGRGRTTRTTARPSRRSRPVTSRARGWVTGRRSSSCRRRRPGCRT